MPTQVRTLSRALILKMIVPYEHLGHTRHLHPRSCNARYRLFLATLKKTRSGYKIIADGGKTTMTEEIHLQFKYFKIINPWYRPDKPRTERTPSYELSIRLNNKDFDGQVTAWLYKASRKQDLERVVRELKKEGIKTYVDDSRYISTR